MSDGERFHYTHGGPGGPYLVTEEVAPAARIIGHFLEEADAKAYVEWRNAEPVPAPKFRVGDRVRQVGLLTNTRVVDAVDEWIRVDGSTAFSPSERWELAPPEPPKPRYRVEGSGECWYVLHDGEIIGSLYSEAVARQVADLLNAAEQRS